MNRMSPFLVVLGIVAVAGLTAGCEPGIDVAIENRTAQPVTLYFEAGADARVEASLGPLEVEEYSLSENVWTGRLIARNPAGTVVFDERISWEEVKRTKRIVIEEAQ